MSTGSITFSVRIPEPLFQAFKALAGEEYDTPSGRLRYLIREDVRTNMRGES